MNEQTVTGGVCGGAALDCNDNNPCTADGCDANSGCAYSDETIALLTSAKKYQDARNGVFQGSTDSEESRRTNEECKVD